MLSVEGYRLCTIIDSAIAGSSELRGVRGEILLPFVSTEELEWDGEIASIVGQVLEKYFTSSRYAFIRLRFSISLYS